jgi:hypothetical protein
VIYRVQVYRQGRWRTRRGTQTNTVHRAAALADSLYEDGTLVRVIDADAKPVGEPFEAGTIAAVRSVGRFLRGIHDPWLRRNLAAERKRLRESS